MGKITTTYKTNKDPTLIEKFTTTLIRVTPKTQHVFIEKTRVWIVT